MTEGQLPFLVVEFTEDNPITVEVIPRSWLISDTECKWPSRLTQASLHSLLRDPVTVPQPS